MAQKAPDLTELAEQRDRVLATVQTLIIGAPPEATDAALPELGVTPSIQHEGFFYIYPSRLSAHVRSMLKTGQAQFLAIEDEATAQNIWARKRIRFTANIIEINRKNDEFNCLAGLFAARHGPTMDLIRDFTDFHMLKLVPTSGVMVLGFAKAYQLDGPGLDIAEHLRES